jgi:hypothetical protein
MDSCKIDDISALSGIDQGIGGAIYFDTVRVSTFSMNNITINNARAEKDGGIFYVQKMKGSIILTKSKFIDFKVSDTQLGSFFYSGSETEVLLSISDTDVKCSSVFTEIEADDAVQQ